MVRPGKDNPNWKGGIGQHPLKDIYYDMVARCERPTHPRFQSYGGRGISVCARWRADFWSFVRDVGERPEGTYPSGRALYSLDRIDNDGNYEPGNVRWATTSEQSLNRRPSAYAGVLRGSNQVASKLSESDVLDIVSRVRIGPRGTQRRLAEEYGVSVSLVNNIWKGKIWNWLTNQADSSV